MSPELKQELVEFYEKDKTVSYFLGQKQKGVCVARMVKKS